MVQCVYAMLANFCINLVAMATPFAPLKIQIAYVGTRKPYYSQEKFLDFFDGTKIIAILADFLAKFGCHGNSLSSLKISHSILEFADPENSTTYAKIVSISCSTCTNLKSVQFWLFWLNLVAMATF